MMLTAGCSHQLTIKNLDMYRGHGLTSFEKPTTIGIAGNSNDQEQRRIMEGVAGALNGYQTKVIFPYSQRDSKPVDVIVHFDITTEHKGSGWNFLVNFPGFLVFAPAWNGYVYKVNYDIDCALIKTDSNERIGQFDVPVALNIRHADMNRTWTEVSWLEWGVIALIGGFVFISYDNNVTPLVSDKMESPLGKYIAQKIVKTLNESGAVAHIQYRGDSELAVSLP